MPQRIHKGGNSEDFQLMFLGDVDTGGDGSTMTDGLSLAWNEAQEKFVPTALATDAALATTNTNLNNTKAAVGINVKDYGAVTGGVVDNSQAFADAIAQLADWGTLVIPGGVYKFTSPVVINHNFVTIRGEGFAQLLYYGSGDAITVTGTDCTLMNLYITNLNSAAGNCLTLSGATGTKLDHVFAVSDSHHACYAVNSWDVSTKDCHFVSTNADAGYAAFYHDTNSTIISHVCSRFSFGANIGAHIKRGAAISFQGCTIQGATGGTGILAEDVQSLLVQGCYFEGFTTGIQVGLTEYVVTARIQGNYFYDTDTNSACVKLLACYNASISNNSFNGTAQSGSVGISIDATTSSAQNILIDANNTYFGVAAEISDTAGRASNWIGPLFTNRRISFGTAAPRDGTVWAEGSIVINTNITDGKNIGWIADRTAVAAKENWTTGHAYTAGDFVQGTTGKIYSAVNSGTAGATPPTHSSGEVSDGAVTWKYANFDNTNYGGALVSFYPFGQVGGRQGGGSPVGVLTPNFVFELYIDYNVPDIYMAYNLTSSGWSKIT